MITTVHLEGSVESQQCNQRIGKQFLSLLQVTQWWTGKICCAQNLLWKKTKDSLQNKSIWSLYYSQFFQLDFFKDLAEVRFFSFSVSVLELPLKSHFCSLCAIYIQKPESTLCNPAAGCGV